MGTRASGPPGSLSASSPGSIFRSVLWDYLVPSEEDLPGPAAGSTARPSAFRRCPGERTSVSFFAVVGFLIVVKET